MTPEFLLDALGLLDDDLIQDAELRTAPKVLPWRRWASWAACLALVLTLGYGAVRLGVSGGGSSAGAPQDSESPSVAGGSGNSSGSSSSGSAEEPSTYSVVVSVSDGARVYTYQHTVDGPEDYHSGPRVDALPENCRSLGVVEALADDITVPHTDVGWYEGYPLWMQGEGWGGPLYVGLPEGGYLVCEYSQTYDFQGG